MRERRVFGIVIVSNGRSAMNITLQQHQKGVGGITVLNCPVIRSRKNQRATVCHFLCVPCEHGDIHRYTPCHYIICFVCTLLEVVPRGSVGNCDGAMSRGSSAMSGFHQGQWLRQRVSSISEVLPQ